MTEMKNETAVSNWNKISICNELSVKWPRTKTFCPLCLLMLLHSWMGNGETLAQDYLEMRNSFLLTLKRACLWIVVQVNLILMDMGGVQLHEATSYKGDVADRAVHPWCLLPVGLHEIVWRSACPACLCLLFSSPEMRLLWYHLKQGLCIISTTAWRCFFPHSSHGFFILWSLKLQINYIKEWKANFPASHILVPALCDP